MSQKWLARKNYPLLYHAEVNIIGFSRLHADCRDLFLLTYHQKGQENLHGESNDVTV